MTSLHFTTPSAPLRGCLSPKACLFLKKGAVRMRSLFINVDAIAALPEHDCVIEVSPLLSELILAAAQVGMQYAPDSRDGRLMRLILDEMRSLPVLPFSLPWLISPRLRPRSAFHDESRGDPSRSPLCFRGQHAHPSRPATTPASSAT